MNKNNRRIIYVGPMSFPEGGAGARRILGNALSLIEAGYEVLVGSGQMPLNGKAIEESVFQGIKVYSIGERTAENKPLLFKHLAYSRMGKKTMEWLKTLEPRPSAIVLYSGDFPYLIRLMPWCKKQQIPLVYEACEWFDPNNIPGGKYSPYRLNHEITMRYLVKRVKNVIAISSYLDNHYNRLGCETICVPPTIDSINFVPVFKETNNKFITLCYTGSPGNKDLFNNYLEALINIDPDGNTFRFNVAGLSDDQIINFSALKSRRIRKMPCMINNFGKVSHEEAIKIVGTSDFSVLLRYPKRYSNAGFPTKVVESMIMGTPVICNLTSDLNKYVQDGVTGVVCKDFSADSLRDALLRIKHMSKLDIQKMREITRLFAVNSFDFRLYSDKLDSFIKRLSPL